MEVVKLTPDFAERVQEVECAIYSQEFLSDSATIGENLAKAEQDKENLSWAVLDKEQLIGYLIGWVDSSAVEGRESEEVVFIDDIGILPGYQNAFYHLIEALVKDIQSQELGNLPIEGTTRVPSFKVFSGHDKIFRGLGYELVASHEYWDDTLSETMVWVRFEPIGQEEGGVDRSAERETFESIVSYDDKKGHVEESDAG